MKYLYNIITILGLFSLLQWNNANAQTLSLKESEEIKLVAQRKIQNGYKDLLNFITDESIGDAEKLATIKDSYGNSNIQVFYNNQTILEDDINPNYYNNANIHDLTVEKYLNNLDILYTKGTENSIDLNIISTSNVKQGSNYMYIKVYFESLFNNKHKTINIPYRKTQRVAELRITKNGKKWVANITRVAFGNTSEENGKDDIVIKTETSNEPIASNTEAETTQNDDLKKEQSDFQRHLSDADDAFKSKEFELSIQAYLEALKKDKDDYGKTFYIKKQISLAKREILKEQELKKQEEERLAQKQKEQNYLRFIAEAKLWQRKRDYNKSIQQYQSAFRIKPDSAYLYQETIRELNKELNIKTETDEMFLAGNFKELKKKYDNYIKKDKSNSDYFLGRAKCAIQLGDSPKSILEDLNESINLDFQNVGALSTRAEYYVSQNNIPKAIADYTSVLSIEPDNAAIYNTRAALKIRTNNLQGAFDDYDKAVELDPKNPQYYFERASLHTQNSAWQKAISDYSANITLNPNAVLAYYYRGNAQFNLQHYKEAGLDFGKAIELQLQDDLYKIIRDRSETFFLTGDKALINGDINEARTNFTNSVLTLPANSRAWYKIGECYFVEKNFTKAIENYTTAIVHNEAYDDAFYKRGVSKYNLGRYKESIEDFHKTNTIVSNYFDALLYEGRALMQLQDFKNAIVIFQRIKISKSSIEKSYSKEFFANMHHYLGVSMVQEKYFAEANLELTTAIKLNNEFSEAYFYRGLTFNELGKSDLALSDLNQTILLGPDTYQKQMAKGIALFYLNQFVQAAEAFQNSVDLDTLKKNISEAYRMKAYSLFKSEKYNEAINAFISTIGNKTGDLDVSIYRDLATCYLFDGQSGKALEIINASLKTNPDNTELNYLLACYYIQSTNIPEGLKVLEKLLTSKAIDPSFIKKDKLINVIDNKLRSTKEFKELIKRTSK